MSAIEWRQAKLKKKGSAPRFEHVSTWMAICAHNHPAAVRGSNSAAAAAWQAAWLACCDDSAQFPSALAAATLDLLLPCSARVTNAGMPPHARSSSCKSMSSPPKAKYYKCAFPPPFDLALSSGHHSMSGADHRYMCWPVRISVCCHHLLCLQAHKFLHWQQEASWEIH